MGGTCKCLGDDTYILTGKPEERDRLGGLGMD